MGTTNFNLRRSVDDYISRINIQGNISASDATELAGHLYDSVDSLKSKGLSEEEAFMIAAKRLGKETVLTQEYAKVSPSIHINKIWAYLLIGSNLFYKVPTLIFLGIGYFYILIYQNFSSSMTSTLIVTSFHLLFIAGIHYLVRQKNQISAFIEKQVQENPVRAVCLSFIPYVFVFIAYPISHISVAEWNAALINYPVRTFQSSIIEYSFYLAVLSVIGGVLSLIFSIKVQGKMSLRYFFEKPSTWFLVLFGVYIELVAASTRVLRFPFDTELIRLGDRLMWVDGVFHKMTGAALFGMFYLIASFLITHYNEYNSVNRKLLIFSSFGLLAEIVVGVNADLSRGDTYYTIYFVTAMLIGIFIGKIFGSKASNTRLIV